MLSTKLWSLYFLSITHSTGSWKHKRPWKLRWRKSEGETEGWMEISYICCLNYSQESGQRPVHSSTLNFWGLSGGQRGSIWEKSLQKSLYHPSKKLGIILLQDGHKERVSLCYNASICGFPPTVFFLRGLSRLLVIITNKPLLWIMVITVSFKDPSHNHCGKHMSTAKTKALQQHIQVS